MTLFCRAILLLALSCILVACDNRNNSLGSNNLPAFVTQKGNVYTITQGQTRLDISANIAGRISSLKIDGVELLLTADKTKNLIWGSVFWSSPQSEWSWPPIEILDSAPYKVSIADDRIEFLRVFKSAFRRLFCTGLEIRQCGFLLVAHRSIAFLVKTL